MLRERVQRRPRDRGHDPWEASEDLGRLIADALAHLEGLDRDEAARERAAREARVGLARVASSLWEANALLRGVTGSLYAHNRARSAPAAGLAEVRQMLGGAAAELELYFANAHPGEHRTTASASAAPAHTFAEIVALVGRLRTDVETTRRSSVPVARHAAALEVAETLRALAGELARDHAEAIERLEERLEADRARRRRAEAVAQERDPDRWGAAGPPEPARAPDPEPSLVESTLHAPTTREATVVDVPAHDAPPEWPTIASEPGTRTQLTFEHALHPPSWATEPLPGQVVAEATPAAAVDEAARAPRPETPQMLWPTTAELTPPEPADAPAVVGDAPPRPRHARGLRAVWPGTRGTSWLARALHELGRRDPDAAVDLAVALLPAHGWRAKEPLTFTVEVLDLAFFWVTLDRRSTTVEEHETMALGTGEFHIEVSVEEFTDFACGALRRRSGELAVTGNRRALQRLLRGSRALTLADAAELGIWVDAELALLGVTAAFRPEWTLGYSFTVGFDCPGSGVSPWHVVVADGRPAQVSSAASRPPASSRVILPEDALLRLICNRTLPEDPPPAIEGNRHAAVMLLRWMTQAQGQAGAPGPRRLELDRPAAAA